MATKTGSMAGPHLERLRLPGNASIFKTVKDPSAGPQSSHWESIFSVGLLSFGGFHGLRLMVGDWLM
jgi:hypothetical protein